MASSTTASHCYSCAGTCHSDNCNCQMGSCEADYCFTEKKPTEVAGVYRITKGCIKRPSRTRIGCDYDHYPDRIQCICAGDFCNDAILLRPMMRRNITCRQCTEKHPDCPRTCQGQWCTEDVTTGATACGYGPPSLPYYYQGPELLSHRSKVCMTLSRGNAHPRKHCICNTHMCNDPSYTQSHFPSTLKLRSVVTHGPTEAASQLFSCVSCDILAQENTMTSACKQNRCLGHFCTYATQRIVISSGFRFGTQAILHEKQGCINVTDGTQIQLGCTHKFNDEGEELYCACQGDSCNEDLSTASQSFSFNTSQPMPFYTLIIILFVPLILNTRVHFS
jgi:hypothetical protein